MSKGAYIGINNVAHKIKKGYIGIDGVARKIKKAYKVLLQKNSIMK